MSESSALRNTSQLVVTVFLAPLGPVLKKKQINWGEVIEGGDGNEFTVNHMATERVRHAQPSVQHKGGKTGVSWIMSKVGQFGESFNLKKKKKEETKSH